MTHTLRRGFKTYAEELALEVRTEIRLGERDPFDPRLLAEHLAIPICSVEDLVENGASPASVRQLMRLASGDFSALTLVIGTYRFVVENPAHASSRRTNSLAHELSHILLEHEPGPAFDGTGCRRWDDNDEAEADWLAGVLLVPRPAALNIARKGTPIVVAARQYGVSAKLMSWRLHQTGAVLQARRELRYKAERSSS